MAGLGCSKVLAFRAVRAFAAGAMFRAMGEGRQVSSPSCPSQPTVDPGTVPTDAGLSNSHALKLSENRSSCNKSRHVRSSSEELPSQVQMSGAMRHDPLQDP